MASFAILQSNYEPFLHRILLLFCFPQFLKVISSEIVLAILLSLVNH